MLSISIGPLALPVLPILLLGSVWLAAWVASSWARRQGVTEPARCGDVMLMAVLLGLLCARLVHVFWLRDLYLGQAWSMLDVRDGGWHVPSGAVVTSIWLGWKAWRTPSWRSSLLMGTVAGVMLGSLGLLWLGTRTDATALPPYTVRHLETRQPMALSQLGQGRIRVVNLWASWCGPCRQEMPMLAAAQRRDQDVVFLFVNQGETADAVQAYLASSSLSLHQVWLDERAGLGPLLGSAGLPATFFYDAQGRLLDSHFGVLSEVALQARLRAVRRSSSPD